MNEKTFIGDVGENIRVINPQCRNCRFYGGPSTGSGPCRKFGDTVLAGFICREHIESDKARSERRKGKTS